MKFFSEMPVYIEKKKAGNSNPKCYLSDMKGCSDKISKEHYISKNLLDKIEKQNRTIDICGLSWLPKECLKSIGKASLASNILCTHHNSKLSGLDVEIGNFFDAIFCIDKGFVNDSSTNHTYQIDGTYIERWVIKTILGMVESNQIVQKSEAGFHYNKKCLDLMCNPSQRWPLGWGLYFSNRNSGVTHHSSSLELIPKHNAGNGELLELGLKFNGFEMNFLMRRPDHVNSFGIHRARKMIFTKGALNSEIHFNWRGHKVGQDVSYSYAGKYSGLSPDHNLPRVK